MNHFLPFLTSSNPEKIALYGKGLKPISYQSLFSILESASAHLKGLGIEQTTHVVVMLPQGMLNALVCLSILGESVCVPLNPASSTDELRTAIDNCAIDVVITCTEYAESLRPLIQAHRIGMVLVDADFRLQMPQLTFHVCEPFTVLHKELATGCEKEKPSLILQTSGSTSLPKCVPLTQGNILASARNIIASLNLQPHDCVVNALPFYHIGAILDVLIVPLLSGGSVVVADAMNAATVSELLHEYPVTWYQGVPTMLSDLLPCSSKVAEGKLRFIRAVSAPLSATLKAQIEAAFDTVVVEMYGMTEACGEVVSNPLDKAQQITGSVGQVRHTQVCILDDTKQMVGVRCEGQVAIAGENVISKYLQSGQQTFESHVEIDGQSWFLTGDNGYLDSQQNLFLTGRLKEIINRGGEKISPSQIDELVLSCDGVSDAACFALPHPTLGEDVGLCIATHSGVDTDLLKQQVEALLRTKLPAYKLPRKIFFTEHLPRTKGGKLQRFRLTEQYSVPLDKPEVGQQTTLENADELTVLVCKIWQEVLAVEKVHPDDDFFDLGGDSLKAVDFILTLEMRLQADEGSIHVSLYDAPTAKAFANALRKADVLQKNTSHNEADIPQMLLRRLRQHLSSWPGVEPSPGSLLRGINIDQKQTKPVMFWCVQGGRESLAMENVLDDNQPLYVMRSLYEIIDRDKRDNDALACHYASEIIALDIDAPLVIGGFCEGGKIAFLIAQLLREQGQNVLLLCLHDTFVPKYYDGRVALFWSKMEESLATINKQKDYYAHKDFSQPELGWYFYYPQLTKSYYYSAKHNDFYSSTELEPLCCDVSIEIKQASRDKDIVSQLEHLPTAFPSDQSELVHYLDNYCKRQIRFSAPCFWYEHNETLVITIQLTNKSDISWLPTAESGLAIQARWLRYNQEPKQYINTFELTEPLPPNESITFELEIARPMPARWRLYWLDVDLVLQGVCWMSERGGKPQRRLMLHASL